MKQTIKSINGLRAVGVLMIFVLHNNVLYRNYGFKLFTYGWMFVEVFTCISGFTMAYNYKDKLKEMSFFDFFCRRYFKIMPLFWLTELVLCGIFFFRKIVFGVDHFPEDVTAFKILFDLTGLSGIFGKYLLPINGVVWFVGCLFLCYVVLWIIVNKTDGPKGYVSVCLIIWFINMYLLVNGMNCGNNDMRIERCVMSFLSGVLLYEIYERVDEIKLGRWVTSEITCFFIIFLLCRKSGISIWRDGNDVYVFASFVFAPTCLTISLYCDLVKRILSTSVFQFIGNISMSMYMWYNIVITLTINEFFAPINGSVLFFVIQLGINVFVGAVSFYCIEPALKNSVEKFFWRGEQKNMEC